MKTVNFNGTMCAVTLAKYPNSRTAILLVDMSDGSPYCKATVNVPDADLAPDEVFIKDYSENKGVYDALLNAGVISPSIDRIPVGYCTTMKCKLLIKE